MRNILVSSSHAWSSLKASLKSILHFVLSSSARVGPFWAGRVTGQIFLSPNVGGSGAGRVRKKAKTCQRVTCGRVKKVKNGIVMVWLILTCGRVPTDQIFLSPNVGGSGAGRVRKKAKTCQRVTCGRVTRAPLSTKHYPIPTINYPLSTFTIHYPLPTTYYPLNTIHYPLPTTHFPLPTINYQLSTTHYPLQTTHCKKVWLPEWVTDCLAWAAIWEALASKNKSVNTKRICWLPWYLLYDNIFHFFYLIYLVDTI